MLTFYSSLPIIAKATISLTILYNNHMDNGNDTLPRARLGRALRKGFIETYDHLGYVVLVSFITFILTAIVGSLMALVGRSSELIVVRMLLMVPAALVAFLCAVGVYYYAGMFVYRERPVLSDTLAGIRLLVNPALKLFAVDIVISAVLAVDFAFFFSIFTAGRNPIAGAVVIVVGYIVIFWMMMAIYHVPLLIAQQVLESGTSIKAVFRKSFLLTMGNLGFTVGLFLVIIALAVLCAVPILIGMAFLFLGTSAFLITHALRELFVRYGIVEEEPEDEEGGGNCG